MLGCRSAHPERVRTAHVHPGRPTVDIPSLGLSFVPDSTPYATSALTQVHIKFAHCRTYRDRGVVIGRSWEHDGVSSLAAHRFDTLFIRDRGLRFRYLKEDGRMTYAVWALGDRIETWSDGFVEVLSASKTSVADVMSNMRGGTGFASWFVPQLLYGRPTQCSQGPWYAGWIHCPTCPEVAFRSPSQHTTTVLSLDLRTSVVRRFYWMRDLSEEDNHAAEQADGRITVIGPGERKIDLARVESLILYEAPEFDVDESVLVSDLDKRPW